MILIEISKPAVFVEIRASSIDTLRFFVVQLNGMDIFIVPDWFKKLVSETKCQNVLDVIDAQKMINSINLVFCEKV